MLLTWFLLGILCFTANAEPQVEGYAITWSGTLDTVREIYDALNRAKDIGREELAKMLDDPRVQNTINKLQGYARQAALKVVQFFKDQLKKIGNEEHKDDYLILREIWDMLSKAAVAGKKALVRMINDSKIKIAVSKLGRYAQQSAINILEYFENRLQEMEEDEGTEGDLSPAKFSFNGLDISADIDLVKEVYDRVQIARERGINFFLSLLDNPDFKNMISKLPESLRSAIQEYIDWARQKLEDQRKQKEIEEMVYSLDNDESSYSAASFSWHETLQDIRSMIKDGLEKGRDQLLLILTSEKLEKLVERLPSMGQRIARRFIEGIRNTLESKGRNILDKMEEIKEKLRVALSQGQDKLVELVNSEDFKNLVDQLPEPFKAAMQLLINRFLAKGESAEALSAASFSWRETLREIRDMIKDAMDKGQEQLILILSSEKLDGLIERLPGMGQGIARRLVNNVRDFLESEDRGILDRMNEIKMKLREALGQGRDKLQEVINSVDFKNLVDQLPEPFKSAMLKMISQFQEKSKSFASSIPEILAHLRQMLSAAARDGINGLNKIIESQKFKDLVARLPSFIRPTVQSLINRLKTRISVSNPDIFGITEETDEATELASLFAEGPESFSIQSNIQETLTKINRYVRDALKTGGQKLREALDSEELENLVQKLPSAVQYLAREFINSLKSSMDNYQDVLNEIKEKMEIAAKEGKEKLVEVMQSEKMKELLTKIGGASYYVRQLVRDLMASFFE